VAAAWVETWTSWGQSRYIRHQLEQGGYVLVEWLVMGGRGEPRMASIFDITGAGKVRRSWQAWNPDASYIEPADAIEVTVIT
jgi:hypothetical protein